MTGDSVQTGLPPDATVPGAEQGRSRRPFVIGGVVVAGLAAVLAVAALVGPMLPDVPGDSFDVRILNDTSGHVAIAQCMGADASCSETGESYDLAPGQSTVAGDVVNAANPWVVRDQSGRELGCLPLLFTTYPEQTPVVNTSAASPTAC